jgi:hypothetical protein
MLKMFFGLFNRLMPFVKLNPKLLKKAAESNSKFKQPNNNNNNTITNNNYHINNHIHGSVKQQKQKQQMNLMRPQSSSSAAAAGVIFSINNSNNNSSGLMRKEDSVLTFRGGVGGEVGDSGVMRGVDYEDYDNDAKSCATNKSIDENDKMKSESRIFLPKENSFLVRYFTQRRRERKRVRAQRQRKKRTNSNANEFKEQRGERENNMLNGQIDSFSSLPSSPSAQHETPTKAPPQSSLGLAYNCHLYTRPLSCNNMALIKNLYDYNNTDTNKLKVNTKSLSPMHIYSNEYSSYSDYTATSINNDHNDMNENETCFFSEKSFRKTKSNLA